MAFIGAFYNSLLLLDWCLITSIKVNSPKVTDGAD